MSKVAVASTDGIAINEHFGRAEEFWIYESNEGGAYQFIERRKKRLKNLKAIMLLQFNYLLMLKSY